MYIDYEFYNEVYGGKVKEADFTRLAIQASSLIDYYTFNRIVEADDKVKMATCELLDHIEVSQKTGNKVVVSEKVDSYSVTYAQKAGKDPIKKEQREIVAKYLGHTGLLYRGL